MTAKPLIVIPSRIGSTRFPKKPLAKISGMSLIERVWRIANSLNDIADCVVATDDEELKEFIQDFGGKCVMTSSGCQTGTDRIAEVIERYYPKREYVINFQGDALLIPPAVIRSLIGARVKSSADIVTPVVELGGEELKRFVHAKLEKRVSTGTTAVFDKDGLALYFSKGLIPNPRSGVDENYKCFLHLGLYAYTKKSLLEFTNLGESFLESIEKLEQLRALENGMRIYCHKVSLEGRRLTAIDRPEDVLVAEQIIEEQGELL